MGSREGVKCQKEQYVKILLHKRDGYMKKQTCKIAMLNENGFGVTEFTLDSRK